MPGSGVNRFSSLVDSGGYARIEESKKRRRNFFDDGRLANKYVVIKRVDEENQSFNGVSPFYIEKGLSMIATGIKETQRTRIGELLVLVDKEEIFRKILSAKKLGDMKIEASEHKYLNQSKGVVYSRDLIMMNEDEIAKELESQKVVKVERIKRKINAELKDTPLLILTFNATELPIAIKAGFLRLEVRTYYPNPMRCHTCQRYGHTKAKCMRVPICPRCAKALPNGHDGIECEPLACSNCKLQHTTYDQKCPTFQTEKAIIKIKTDERITYFKAKELYYRQNANTTGGQSKRLYSDVVQEESASKNTSNQHNKQPTKSNRNTSQNNNNNNINNNNNNDNNNSSNNSNNDNNKNNNNNNYNNNNNNSNSNSKKNNNNINNKTQTEQEKVETQILKGSTTQEPRTSSTKINLGAAAATNIEAAPKKKYTFLNANELGIVNNNNDVGMSGDDY